MSNFTKAYFGSKEVLSVRKDNNELFSPSNKPIFLGNDYFLTFQEEFLKEDIDTDIWTKKVGNYADAEMDSNNIYIEDNNLIIAVTKESGVFKSGLLTTEKVVDANSPDVRIAFRYGYFEAKMKLPEGVGIVPSFWINSKGMIYGFTNNLQEGGAEIDIIEHTFAYNQGGVAINSVHIDGYGGNTKTTQKFISTIDISDGEYHTYGLLWEENKYTFYIDEVIVSVIDDFSFISAAFEHLCLSANVYNRGVLWAGDAIENTNITESLNTTTKLKVEYVKVWQTTSMNRVKNGVVYAL